MDHKSAKYTDEVEGQQGQSRMSFVKDHTLVLRPKFNTAEGERGQLSTEDPTPLPNIFFLFPYLPNNYSQE
ncbi:MAG: hypothetical protein GY820_33210 [Gammaproteobacteria bacterium]|nr:hypothetical protein [Gammaproteobacteria bacterium]